MQPVCLGDVIGLGDVTDAEWVVLAPLIPPARPGGRPRSVSTREILNAILYRERMGCPWRYLPDHLPPWGTVFYYLRRWRCDGTWPRLVAALLQLRAPAAAGVGERRPAPRLVPLAPVGPAARGAPPRAVPVPAQLVAVRPSGWLDAGTHLASRPVSAEASAAWVKAWQPM